MRVTLPYPPQANHLYTIARGRKILSTKGRQYKADVGLCCLALRLKPLSGNVVVSFTAFRPRRIGDIDNLIKPVLDGLKGAAFHDDKQIIEIHAFRDDDKANPRIELEITEV